MDITVRRALPQLSVFAWSLIIPETKMDVGFLYSKFYKIRIFAEEHLLVAGYSNFTYNEEKYDDHIFFLIFSLPL